MGRFSNLEKSIIIAIATILVVIGYTLNPEITLVFCSMAVSYLVINYLIGFDEKQRKKAESSLNYTKPKIIKVDFELTSDSPYVISSTGDRVLLKNDYIYLNRGKRSKIVNCIANNTWEAIDPVELKIPLDVITIINYKDSGMYKGYLEFIYPGFNVRSRDTIKHLQENIITFNTEEESDIFLSFKEIVENRIRELKNKIKGNSLSVADEIKKLAELKNQGILTEKEFLSQKNKLMEL